MSLQDPKSLDLFPVVLSKIYHWLCPCSECRKWSGGDKNYKQRRIREVGKECSYKGACFCFVLIFFPLMFFSFTAEREQGSAGIRFVLPWFAAWLRK